jgi:hypothetical protein
LIVRIFKPLLLNAKSNTYELQRCLVEVLITIAWALRALGGKVCGADEREKTKLE